MTFFESGGTGSPPSRGDGVAGLGDGVFDEMRRARRRRRLVVAAGVVATLAAALFVAVLAVGPERVATSVEDVVLGPPPEPAADLVSVADRAFLTDEGRTLLYRQKPRIATVAEVAEACQRSVDDPPVGCFNAQQGIYVYQPSDPRVADWAVVTLAHELLHAAYARFDDGERATVAALLETEMARVPEDDPVHAQIAWSVGENEGSRVTEQFAFLGSQLVLDGGFSPELEAVYARYFTDRAALAAVDRRVAETIDGVYAEAQVAFDALAVQEQSNANARGQLDADRVGHEQARVDYNADADRYNAMSESERGRWRTTWTSFDGTVRTAPLGEALQQRLADLEAYRVDLDRRAASLGEEEAAAAARRAEAEAQYEDLKAMVRSAKPGATLE